MVKSEDELKTWHDKYVQEGYEGLIIREPQGMYELGRRSRHLLKYKEFRDKEFVIAGWSQGIGKFAGCVIWECKTSEGKTFNVVPKGTLEMKQHWYKFAPKFLGRKLTVRYQAWTNDNIPQFPVGIAIRDYE
jgi:DNA ligase-1